VTILQFSGAYAPDPLEAKLARALGEHYVVERELGGSGMSRVFLVTDTRLQRRVAVKVLAPELAATVSLDRFRREILLAAGLQHPHIVGVVSAGDAEGLPYFVMPFVDGESLRVRIRSGPLPIPEAVHILRDVARALTYAHAQGVVHRDIKPDSVLLASGSATVADFGVAKALSSARLTPRQSDHTITSDGTSLGTPTYMAPEQAAADPATDHRADIYAFGVTAYEMVTGRLPFRADTPQELLAARLTERPRPPREERPDVPVALDRLIMACLEKRPADRPQSAAALLAALDNPEMTSGAHTAPSLPAARSRRWWAALGVAAVFGAAALYLGRRTTAAPPDPRSIAVLAVVDATGDTASARIAGALTDETRASLGRIPGVKIASGAQTDLPGAPAPDLAALGRRLHVASLLESALERDGTRLRLSVRLVSAKDGLSLWGDVLEGDAKTLFDARRELMDTLVSRVGAVLDGARDPARGAPPG
jgi:TolB-like protein/tRNA A-37 threonylcarbamoyl transferase component Bud32